MDFSSGVHHGFTARGAGGRRPSRLARLAWTIAAAAALVGVKAGCGQGPGGGAAMVKDPPPLAPEETTDALFKSKARTR